MSSAVRYAIYLAPETDTPLWALGSALIGYDAATGREVDLPPALANNPVRWQALTDDPRRYGFHMTLKAPFRLAPGRSVAQLETHLEELAARHSAFEVGRLGLECRIGADGTGFVCLAPQQANPALMALEATIMPALEEFRAPLSVAERARRKPERLSEKQRDYLERFGYPFVLDEFRPHFSLTGAHSNPGGSADRLSMIIANTIGAAEFSCRSLFLFEQAEPSSRFVIRGRFALHP